MTFVKSGDHLYIHIAITLLMFPTKNYIIGLDIFNESLLDLNQSDNISSSSLIVKDVIGYAWPPGPYLGDF